MKLITLLTLGLVLTFTSCSTYKYKSQKKSCEIKKEKKKSCCSKRK